MSAYKKQVEPFDLESLVAELREGKFSVGNLIQGVKTEDKGLIKYLQDNVVPEELYNEVLRRFPLFLKHVGQTESRCMLAVSSDGHALQWVKHQTEGVCLEAVKACPTALYMVKNQTEVVCRTAIDGGRAAFKQMRKKTDEMALLAISKYEGAYMSHTNKSAEFTLKALAVNGSVIACISNPTREQWKVAINSRPHTVKRLTPDVAVGFRNTDPELWELAISKDGRLFRELVREDRTDALANLALMTYGYALGGVANPSYEQCKLAVMMDGDALQFVPAQFRTEEVCDTAVSNAGFALQFVPEELRTASRCGCAVKQSYLALEYVPESVLTDSFIDTALMLDGNALRFVEAQTETRVLLAVKSNPAGVLYAKDMGATLLRACYAVNPDIRSTIEAYIGDRRGWYAGKPCPGWIDTGSTVSCRGGLVLRSIVDFDAVVTPRIGVATGVDM